MSWPRFDRDAHAWHCPHEGCAFEPQSSSGPVDEHLVSAHGDREAWVRLAGVSLTQDRRALREFNAYRENVGKLPPLPFREGVAASQWNYLPKQRAALDLLTEASSPGHLLAKPAPAKRASTVKAAGGGAIPPEPGKARAALERAFKRARSSGLSVDDVLEVGSAVFA